MDPSRKSLRIKYYDYSQPGGYFITICAQNKYCFFGDINQSEMVLNAAGQMAQEEWDNLCLRFPNITLDASIIMPNHMHAVIIMEENDKKVSLGSIIQAYKSITTNNYIHGVRNKGWLPFNKRLWQRNYFEHIIRNDQDLEMIREYIMTNPQKWDKDRFHPVFGK
jgi:REP element-mobilizing transposase RayT